MSSGLPRISECRDCHDPVRFVHLESGKSIPVNPRPAPDGRGTIAARLVMTDKGKQLRGYAISAARPAQPHNPYRFTVHAATCTERPRNAPAPADVPDEADAPLF